MTTYDYDAAWLSVKELQEKGLPRDAISLVDDILKQATSDQYPAQLVKSVYTLVALRSSIEPSQQVAILEEYEKAAPDYDPVSQALVYSYLAAATYSHFQQIQWQIANRTDTSDALPEDRETWTKRHYYLHIHHLHQKALSFKSALDVDISGYEEIVTEYDDRGKELRPTLYLLVGSRAVDFYSSAQNMVVANAKDYQWSDASLMSATDQFVKLDITNDSLQVQAIAMGAMQDLERYALDKGYRSAAYYLHLERVKAVYRSGSLANAKEVYVEALHELSKSTDDYIATEAKYLLAGHYRSDDLPTTLALLNDLLSNYPKKLPAVVQAHNLQLQLQQPTLSGRLASTVYPNKDIDLSLSHRNMKTCTYTIYRSSYDFRSKYSRWRDREKFIKDIKKQDKVSTGSISLTSGSQYEQVETSASLEGLPAGQYEVILTGTSGVAGQVGDFHVSLNVTTLAAQFVNTGTHAFLLVTDRWTGSAISGVKVDCYSRVYNQDKRRNEQVLATSNVTDVAGVSSVNGGSNFIPKLSYNGEIYHPDASVNAYIQQAREPRDIVSVMTDRSIYRPGQLLYYKVLAVDVGKEDKTVHDRKSVTIELRDANRKEIYSTKLITNEFGSVSGSITLPSDGLPGTYSMVVSVDGSNATGRGSLRVEAYKRPKFAVVINSPTDRKVLGDEISVTGVATALAGPAISDAAVKYSVTRSSYRPWWRRWSRYYPSDSPTTIETGQVVTDSDGAFSIDFVADYPSNQGDRYFNYSVAVDITDTNGETRSASKTLSLSTKAVRLTTKVPELVLADSTIAMELSAQNFAGKSQDVAGEIVIHSLEEPAAFVYDGIPQQGYRRRQEPKSYTTWLEKAEVLRQSFDTGADPSAVVQGLVAGTYRLRLLSESTDTFEAFFVVIDYKGKKHSPARLLYHKLDQGTYQPGDLATLSVAASDDVQVYYLLERKGSTKTEWLPMTSSTATLTIPIREADRGVIYYKLLCVSNNRYFVEDGVIAVPFSNKQLTVELETWRDKILPGAEEKWSLKIKGPKGDQVAAEVLAAMYDASLDQFISHSWQTSFWHNNASKLRASSFDFYLTDIDVLNGGWNSISGLEVPMYKLPYLVWSGMAAHGGARKDNALYYIDGVRTTAESAQVDSSENPAPRSANQSRKTVAKMSGMSMDVDEGAAATPVAELPSEAPTEDISAPLIRSDFRETVFFYPDLRTDSLGNLSFTFTMSEALTKWRSMFLAHTKDLKSGYTEQVVQTQKDLMIVGNSPRFLRAGDKISLTGKVSNLSDSAIKGTAIIRLINALTEEPLGFLTGPPQQSFSLDQGGSTSLAWEVEIPRDFVTPVTYEIVAQSGKHSDGERHLLPTVSNRKLVTETMPMYVPGGESKGFVFDRLKDAKSPTLHHQQYTVEFTSNPIWYVLQALPTLLPKTVETSDYIAQRLYATLVGQHVVQLSPKVKQVFDQWQAAGSDALLSNLEKNEALKTTILNETPWVRDAADESMQRRLIAAFFDINALSSAESSIIRKLRERQRPDGGFPWCVGGRSSSQTTQRVLLSLGRLHELSLLPDAEDIGGLMTQAHLYHDEALKEQYDRMRKSSGYRAEDNHLSPFAIRYIQVQTLLQRSDQGVATDAYRYYIEQMRQYWLSRPLTEQAIIGQVLYNLNENGVAAEIVESLRQFSISSPEMGMYWEQRGYGWSHLPIERQTEMIRFFALMGHDDEVVEQTLHLLQLKKTNRWPTSAATTAAVHTFLTQQPQQGDWLSTAQPVYVKVGGQAFDTRAAEAGTLYAQQDFEPVEATLSDITVTNPNEVVAWGAAYWQYWEDLDRITTFDDTPLKVSKAFYKKVKSDRGSLLEPVVSRESLNLGDKLVSRIIIESDRPMSFVHMQDMRPAGVEPVDVLSAYTYRDGLAYYHATRDLSTDFYIDYLPKGKHVVEYDVFVSHLGDFSTGIATLQSYYAPEYTSHSQGSRINVE